MKKIIGKSIMRKLPLSIAIGMLSVASANAVEFNFGDLSVQVDNTVSYGIAMRTEKPDAAQIMPGNANEVGISAGSRGFGSSYNYDDGTLNYKQGDVYTNVFKWSGDLEARYKNYGFFARARAWYDTEIMDGSTRFKPLVDGTKSYAGRGAEVLDAFVWGDFVAGETPINVRLGRQVVNWGESLFIQGGINSINPVDASAFRRPGAEIKEGLLPVNMLFTSIGLTDSTTLEAFYQLQWEKTRTDPCGTFFSTIDFVADGCGPVILAGDIDERTILELRQAEIDAGVPLFNRIAPVTERLSDDEPRDDGQFGLALRSYTDLFGGTEFGAYYMNIHSRMPYISGVVSNKDSSGGQINPDPYINSNRPLYQIAYPEDIQIMGVSFSTSTANGASISGEISYKPDLPMQWNAFELILGGNLAPYSRMYQDRLQALGGDVSKLAGTLMEGWDNYDVWQAQMSYIQFFDRVMGADRLSLVAEVGVTHVAGLPSLQKARYGRSGAYGIGDTAGVAPGTGNWEFCSAATTPLGDANTGMNVNPQNCTDEGYVTEWSGGIRVRTGLEYSNVFSGVNVAPSLMLSYDSGYGPEPGAQFIDKRFVYSLGVSFVYQNNATVDVSYTGYEGGDYDQMIDRDNVALALKYSF